MQIAKRRVAHMEKRPDAKIIPLGIGDTTEPLTETVSKAMADAALGMGTREGYSGYAPALINMQFTFSGAIFSLQEHIILERDSCVRHLVPPHSSTINTNE